MSYDVATMKAKGYLVWIVLAALAGACFFILPRAVMELWVAESLTDARLGDLGVAGLAPGDPSTELSLLREVAEANGLSLPVEPEVGSQLFDADCDGDLDLFTLGRPDARREPGRPPVTGEGWERRFELYLGDGMGRFREVGDRMGADFKAPRKAVASRCQDLDRDGLLDLVIFLADGSRLALWNRLSRRKYLPVVLDLAPGAEGPTPRKIRVELVAGGRKQVRIATVGGGLGAAGAVPGAVPGAAEGSLAPGEGRRAAARSVPLHFGLGAAGIEKLVVFWSPERTLEIRGLPANREAHAQE